MTDTEIVTWCVCCVFIVIAAIYAFFVMYSLVAFVVRKSGMVASSDSRPVSVIVAFRNEAGNLKPLVESLLRQSFSGDYEIILVNDHSSDNSMAVVSEYSDSRVRCLDLPTPLSGKKQALLFAVQHARHEILAFTDADCIVGRQWLELLTADLQNNTAAMTCGPVDFEATNGLLNSCFRLEFMSLAGMGAASFFYGKPIMCNAANLAIHKNIYLQATKALNMEYASGDDTFLLHYVADSQRVTYCKSLSATVVTHAPSSIGGFLSQRIRWASKTTADTDTFTKFVAATVFLCNLNLLILAGIGWLSQPLLLTFVVAATSKVVIDFCFLAVVTRFFGHTSLLAAYLPTAIFYPLYIVIAAIAGLCGGFVWKNRKQKH